MGFKVDDIFVDFAFRFGGARRSAAQVSEATRKMGRTAGTAADAQERLARSTRRAGTSARNARGQIVGMGKAAKGAKSQIAGLVKGFIGFEVARRLLTGIVRTFFDFRAEMNNVKAITGATSEEFARLTATAKELGRTTQFTATDAAGALKFLTRTGLDANQAIAALPDTLNLAAATASDLATAADIATNIMKGMGLEVSQLERVVDVLAKTTSSSNVDIFELGEGMKTVAPVAAAAGQSIEELSAIMGVLGDAGIKGSLAGVALRRSIINLTTGTGNAGKAIERLNLQVRDAEGNFVGLANIFEQLEGKILGPTDLFELFGARALAAAQVLRARGGEAIDAFTEKIRDSAGTAERMRKDQMEGLVGAGKRLKSAFEALALTIGDGVEPTLVVMADTMRNFVLPVLTNMFRIVQLLGPAAFVLAEANIAAFNLIKTAVFELGATILETFGKVFRFIGELGERFLPDSLLGQAAAGLAQFGADAQLAGSRFRRSLDGDMTASVARLRQALGFAGESVGEILDGVIALGEEGDFVAGQFVDLSEALDDAAGNMANLAQVAGLDLDLGPFRAQLAALQVQIRETLGIGGAGAFDLQEQVAVQRELLALDEDRRKAVQDIVDAEAALAETLTEIERIQTDIVDNQEDQIAVAELQGELVGKIKLLARQTVAAEKAMKAFGETGKKATKGLLDEATLVIRAVNRIADAFGLVDDGIRQAVDSVLDLIRALKVAKTESGAISIAAAAGVAGAAVGLGAALAGGLLGPDLLRGAEATEDNTAAIRRLTQNIDTLRGALGAAPGEAFAGAAELIDQILAGQREIGRIGMGGTPILGLTEEELRILEEVAEAFGLTLDVIKGTGDAVVLNTEQLEAMKRGLDALDFTKLVESFEGAIDLMQRRLDLLDIEEPLERLEELRRIFLEFTDLPPQLRDALENARLDTPEGRRAFEKLLLDLFDAITAGDLDLAALGGLTLDEFLNAVGSMEGLVDKIDDTDISVEGATSDFVRSSRITEAQGSVMVAILDSTLVLERLQLIQLNRIADAITGQPLTVPGPDVIDPLRPPSTAVGINIDEINIEVIVGPGGAPEAGAVIAEDITSDLDARLEAWRLDKERSLGL